jgi:CheY-like chemotaxis protein
VQPVARADAPVAAPSLRAAAGATRTPLAGATPAPSPATISRLAGRVLVAEDDQANREFLVRALERMGLTVQAAIDGDEALGALTTAPAFDAVLLDVRMPGIDGIELARRIRRREAHEGLRRCPVVAVTANAFEEDRRECLDAGMDEVLAKPLLMTELGPVAAGCSRRRAPRRCGSPSARRPAARYPARPSRRARRASPIAHRAALVRCARRPRVIA